MSLILVLQKIARTAKPLTNTEVQQAKPKRKEFNLIDGDGLALRVKPNGSKLWILDYYRLYTKKRTSLSLGTYPSITLAEARQKRTELRKLLTDDINPKEYREEQARVSQEAPGNILEHVAAQWLDVKKSTITPDHATDTWRSLELQIFPDMGNIPLHKITTIKAIDTLKPIAAKGSLETIKRLCQRLNEIMVYAVPTGIVASNPLTGIKQAFQKNELMAMMSGAYCLKYGHILLPKASKEMVVEVAGVPEWTSWTFRKIDHRDLTNLLDLAKPILSETRLNTFRVVNPS